MELESLLNEAYKHKGYIERSMRLSTHTPHNITRMCFNENFFGMSPKAKEVYLKMVDNTYIYPDFRTVNLKQALADYYDFSIDNVIAVAGSSVLIDMIGAVFLNPGDEVLYCAPTFGAYYDMAIEHGGVPVEVPLDNQMRFDLSGLKDKISEKTKIIVICNPNNPTGTYLNDQAMAKFIKELPKDIIVMVDEAYLEFSEASDCQTMLPLIKECPDQPIIVLKTFSKVFGMAGLRVGYGLANEDVIDQLMRSVHSWNVSLIGEAVAIEALKDTEHLNYVIAETIKGRHYLEEQLEKLGCIVYPSQTSFIYFDTHRDPQWVMEELLQEGVMIGAFAINRVSIANQENNERFIEKLKVCLAK